MTAHRTWVPAALKPSAKRIGTLALVAGLAFPLAVTTSTYAAAPLPTSGAMQFAAPDAGSVQVSPADIAPDDTTYAGWHQGAVNAGVPGEFDVTADGLALSGRSQVIKGYENNSKDVGARNVSLMDVIPDASFTVSAGAPVFQIPIFYTVDGTSAVKFATLRPAAASVAGVNALSLSDNWISSGDVGTVPKNTEVPLSTIVAQMDRYKVIAFGVYSQAGNAAVSSIDWAGTTYDFVQAPIETSTVDNAAVLPFETNQGYPSLLAGYAGWHQGGFSASALGSEDAYRVTADGLEMDGAGAPNPQVINGYADNTNDLSTGRNAVLPFAFRKSSLTVTAGSAFWQVPVFYDNGGGVKFTTLRSAAPVGIGEHAIELSDQWTASRTISETVQKDEPAALSDIVAALGSYKVIAFGVLASDDSVVIPSLTWDGTRYDFKQAAPVETPVKESEIAPNEDVYAGWHEGADVPGALAAVGNDGLELTGPSQIIKGYTDNALNLSTPNVDLVAALRSASYTIDSVGTGASKPVFQVAMNARVAGANGNANAFATLRPATSRVGVNSFTLEGMWVSSKTVGNWTKDEEKPLKDLLKDLRDYKVIAFGVYQTTGDATVSDITWDGTRYTFANTAPTAAPVTGSTKGGTAPMAGQPVTVTLGGADVDGNALTYAATGVNGGTATVAGDQLTFRPDAGFSGTAEFGYTVDDGRGGLTEGPVSIAVAANTAPAVAAAARTMQVGKAVAIALAGTDADGDPITYSTGTPSPAKGTVNQTGSRLVYTADASFTGTVTLPVTVTDNRGGKGTANVTYTVVKGVSTISTFAVVGTPRSTTAPKFTVKVTAGAGRVNAGIVTLSQGGRIGSGRVNAAGEVTITTSKLKKGRQTILASFGGSTTTGTATKRITITVG